MSTPAELMAAGTPSGAASQIGQDLATGLVATGTTKATALALAAGISVFATVSSGKSAVLPPVSGAPVQVIYNAGANALALYAQAGNTINALSTGATFSVTNAKVAIFFPSGTRWVGGLMA